MNSRVFPFPLNKAVTAKLRVSISISRDMQFQANRAGVDREALDNIIDDALRELSEGIQTLIEDYTGEII